jgi:hypothetical protein
MLSHSCTFIVHEPDHPVQYRAFHAPDNHFALPLDESFYEGHFPSSVSTVHGEWPHYIDGRDIIQSVPCYGGVVRLVPPLITIAARLLFVAVRELQPMGVPDSLYRDRAHATQLGHGTEIQPTQADVHEVNASAHARIRARPNWEWLAGLTPAERHHEVSGLSRWSCRAPSARLDDEFLRLMYCNDTYHTHPEKGRVHILGLLTGNWAGRFNVRLLTNLHRLR